jgi:peptidoglycan/LPS O-acetylase OafA/YrhL
MSPRWAQWPMANRAMRWMGTISYGIYVFHLVFIRFAVHTLGFPTDGSTGAFLQMLVFTFAGSLAAGWAAHVLIERPVRGWAVRVTRRAPAAGVAPTPALLPVPALERPVSEPV